MAVIWENTFGDTSGDGHGKKDTYIFKSECIDIEDVDRAYSKAIENLDKKYHPDSYCNEFEDSKVPVASLKEMVKIYDIPWPWNLQYDEESGKEFSSIGTEDLANIVASIVTLGGVPTEVITLPTAVGIRGMGYGCFYM